MPHTWKRALDEYRYPVDLRKFSGAPECDGWFELNICPGDPLQTMGFECRFREQARHHREAWGELVFWKLFTIPPARNQRAQRVLDLEVRPAELWSSCMNYIDKSDLASFRAFKRVLRVQGSGVALAATFPAFLCPDRFPMVDTQVTKWALDNHAKHTYSAIGGPDLVSVPSRREPLAVRGILDRLVSIHCVDAESPHRVCVARSGRRDGGLHREEMSDSAAFTGVDLAEVVRGVPRAGPAASLEPGRRSGGDCCAGRGRTARPPRRASTAAQAQEVEPAPLERDFAGAPRRGRGRGLDRRRRVEQHRAARSGRASPW